MPGFPSNIIQINRNNHGYDFGGYQAGIVYALQNFMNISEITICNNSVILISDGLEKLFEQISISKYDVVGLTDSYERCWHLQSYFLHFKKNVISSEYFLSWWKDLPISDKKTDTVNKIEIPLAGYFQSRGFKVGALWPFLELKEFALSINGVEILSNAKSYKSTKRIYSKLNSNSHLNSTHSLWRHLIYLNFPFIKKDLAYGRVPNALSNEGWEVFNRN